MEKSDSSPGHGGSSPGNSASNSSASNSSKSKDSVVRQLASQTNMSMGELSRVLKSWRSIDRADPAYAANIDNPNSLPGRQLAYVSANQGAQTALSSYQTLVTSLGLSYTIEAPPTLDEYNAALATLNASSLDPQTVLQDATGAYTPEQYAAADIVAIYEAWDSYQKAETDAENKFLATLAGNPDTYDTDKYDSLRAQIDEMIVLRGLANL